MTSVLNVGTFGEIRGELELEPGTELAALAGITYIKDVDISHASYKGRPIYLGYRPFPWAENVD